MPRRILVSFDLKETFDEIGNIDFLLIFLGVIGGRFLKILELKIFEKCGCQLLEQGLFFTESKTQQADLDVVFCDEKIRSNTENDKYPKDNGTFSDWGFQPGRAVTHTIAYTIRGFQECARLLNDYAGIGQPVEQALEILYRRAELANGRLAGEFDEDWHPTSRHVCLRTDVRKK